VAIIPASRGSKGIRRKETSVMVEYKDLTSGLPLRELQL
jgi:CMP-N-acetylneuraminic acid synthetase